MSARKAWLECVTAIAAPRFEIRATEGTRNARAIGLLRARPSGTRTCEKTIPKYYPMAQAVIGPNGRIHAEKNTRARSIFVQRCPQNRRLPPLPLGEA
jgi:hypothetical protein